MARPSPPTERVVGVLNLLAGQDGGLTASAIARLLDMTGSTCATVLSALDGADYVERSPDKTYRLGSGLLPLAQALQDRFPLLGVAHDELSRLCAELRCAATLTRIADDHLRVVVAVGADGHEPLGVTPGDRFPLSPPYGAIAMAWRPQPEIDRWIDSSPNMTGAERDHDRQVMADIRTRGVGVWSLEERAAPLVDRIRSLIGELATGPTDRQLHDQLTALFAVFGRHGYTREELAMRPSLSVGYVLAAIFGLDGQPRYEIDLHLLRPRMTSTALDAVMERVAETATLLTGVIGGEPAEDLCGT